MALANAVQGARHTAQRVTWTDTEGDALNLTGATLSGRILDEATGLARDMDGTLSIISPTQGVFDWQYGELDVGAAGAFRVQFTASYGASGSDRTLQEEWRVEAAI